MALEEPMSAMTYPVGRTAYLLVDPPNDFPSDSGQSFAQPEAVATDIGLHDNLRKLDRAVRAVGIQVAIVSHRRREPGDYEGSDQSGFDNTDLDMRLKQRGISHVIVAGLPANGCIESTARNAMALGYHVTLVRDATAAFRPEPTHAAHELNGPTYAHAIVTVDELITLLAPPNLTILPRPEWRLSDLPNFLRYQSRGTSL
jgi:nicotinamidase-related amidase